MNTEILQLYRDYNQAMAADDTAALDCLLGPDFTLTHMTGYVQPRAEWLGELKRGTMHYFSSIEDHVAMRATTSGWQVTGQNRVVASIHGSGRHEWPLNTVMTVSQIDGRWQILSAVVTTY
ncbi:nuclear transport factor 2 family protein [Levilactobacillus suantsaiihabitans]|uniref:Nuclear transport factor 2 family protein n=1 Tax=Levilactobacillus suantsaiihabitans TaxID=2487722 RepID=A0A4Z0J7Y1_9LACO|nr:nuclear transport factor 2 family protein [Levilactobacillus suantsaiihabitans]TGD18356.1 nuclear transport factor 2 family protein [Levilactobacillus suantsaiihabitans]